MQIAEDAEYCMVPYEDTSDLALAEDVVKDCDWASYKSALSKIPPYLRE
jgi:hypothetical protein